MATFNYTIKSSGGDFTSLSAFEASLPGSGTDTYIATYDEALSDTTNVRFNGIGVGNTIVVTVAAAYRCKGQLSGSHAELRYTGSGNVRTLWNDGSHGFTVEHLRIIRDGSGGGSYTLVDSSFGSPVYKNCTFVRLNVGNGGELAVTNIAGTPAFYNCVFAMQGMNVSGLHMVQIAAGTSKLYNCTFIARDCPTMLMLLASSGSGTIDARNCVLLKDNASTNACASGSYSGGSNRNATVDGSAPGSNPQTWISIASIASWQPPDQMNPDWASRTRMVEAGVGEDLSSVFTDDITGKTRTEWFKGAFYADSDKFLVDVSQLVVGGVVLLKG